MINNLRPTDLNCNVFSCYDYDGLSMQELLCQFFTAINECIDQTNENKRLTDHLLDVGVSEETSKKIEQLISSGRMAALLNDGLLKDIITSVSNLNVDINTTNTKVDNNKTTISTVETEFNNKVDEINKKIKELDSKQVTKEAVKEAATEEIKKAISEGTLASAKIADKTITNNKIKDGSISIRSLNFIKRSANLFDRHAKGIKLDVFIDSQGNQRPGGSYYVSDFISIKPGDTIMVPRLEASTIALYDSNKKWIETPRTESGGQKYVIPSNDKIAYMTYNGNKATIAKDMIVLGTSYPSGYVPYELAFDDDIKENIIDNILNTADLSVDDKLSEIIDTSINLFDHTMSGYTEGQYFNSFNGTTQALPGDYAISPYFQCEPNTTYSVTALKGVYGQNAYKVIMYDKNKQIIPNVVPTVTAETYTTITTPNNARYFRFNTRPSTKDQAMVVKGSVYPLKFIPFNMTLSNQFFFNHKQKTYIDDKLGVIDGKLDTIVISKLKGKKVIFDGDSICQGVRIPDQNNKVGGWASRIIEKHNMIGQNFGIGGGTITAGTMTSGGSQRHWLVRSIDNNLQKVPNPDYIILEGGTNDADLLDESRQFGTITSGVNGPFDDTTFTGAVEKLFYEYVTRNLGAKIGFIIAPKMGGYNTSGYNKRRRYFDRIAEVAEKYGIPVLDLWKTCYITPGINGMKALQYDGQHLTDKGYEYITPMIEAWMETL